ncbi:MAG: hypothetical protein M1281_04005 [Chloroflexi bacterium]|nr:hypothetical protein [Chloroflexota bacterium]
MKKFMTLLGVFTVGEGLVLALLPEGYIDFWAKIVSFTLPKGTISPRGYAAARLLGLSEMVFGVWWVTQGLSAGEALDQEGEG